MKIYRSKVPLMAQDIAKALIKEEAVEVNAEDMSEFYLDIESVLRSYIDTDKRIHDEAQELLTSRGFDFSAFHRVKRDVAKKYNFALDEDAIDWITDQLIELLLYTTHVEEVWAENNVIRRIARPILLKHTSHDEGLDEEVRKRIKNLSEGSLAWDVKYQQVLEEIRRQKGLG